MPHHAVTLNDWQMPLPYSSMATVTKKAKPSRKAGSSSSTKSTRTAAKKPKRSRKPKRSSWSERLTLARFPRLRRWVLGALVCGLIIGAAMGGYVSGAASSYRMEDLRLMLDAERVATLPDEAFPHIGGIRPEVLRIDAFPPHLIDALTAREDSRFFSHSGVDLIGVGRAVVRNIEEKRLREGAGTITMQVARTAYGIRAKTLRRKAVEMALAKRIEREFTKQEILALYLNWVFLGDDNQGFGRAAESYFGKSVSQLTLSESAMLVGILRAPNGFHPVRHYADALDERNAVLQRMVAEQMITPDEADVARAEPVRVTGR